MSDKNALILSIISTILKYGPKAVIDIAGAMTKEDVTPEDITNLFITKRSEDYF